MRVAMIGQKGAPATYGGIERHVEELARRFPEHGVETDIYCRPHYTPRNATLPGARLLLLPSINTKHLDAITHTVLSTGHALFHGADVVHYHALGPSAMAWAPRLRGQKVVATVHGLDWQRDKWGRVAASFLRIGEWCARSLPHATIVVSKTLAAHFREAGARNVHYVPNGTPLPPAAATEPLTEFGLEPDRFLLFVGRLVPEKGLHLLVRAHREAVPDWPLVIAGGGHFTDAYVEACRRVAGDNVHFLGPVYGESLAALQAHAALVVVPSFLEGLSIALLEAMSHGTAVLGSDIPENVEVVQGVGETFASGDVPDLGRRLKELLPDAARRNGMGIAARDRIAREYDWERVTERTAEVYRSLAL